MTGAPVVKVFKGTRGVLYYWHVVSGGRIVSDGSQGYVFRSSAVRAAKRRNPTLPVVVVES